MSRCSSSALVVKSVIVAGILFPLGIWLACAGSETARAQGVFNQLTTGGIKDTPVAGSGGVNAPPPTAAGTGGTTNLNTSLGGFGTNLRSDLTPRPLPPRSHVRY